MVRRSTSETDVFVEVNLDGSGKSEITTGLGFYDHMLDQIARHGKVDLTIRVKGDLHIDEHHTVEDTAIALGEAFLQALGKRKGLHDTASAADGRLSGAGCNDFGGRPWLVWNVDLTL